MEQNKPWKPWTVGLPRPRDADICTTQDSNQLNMNCSENNIICIFKKIFGRQPAEVIMV